MASRPDIVLQRADGSETSVYTFDADGRRRTMIVRRAVGHDPETVLIGEAGEERPLPPVERQGFEPLAVLIADVLEGVVQVTGQFAVCVGESMTVGGASGSVCIVADQGGEAITLVVQDGMGQYRRCDLRAGSTPTTRSLHADLLKALPHITIS